VSSSPSSSALRRFRIVSLLEGISYLVLLGIAMPLKYVAGQPEAVTHLGRVHGGLFVLFVIALIGASSEQQWRSRASGTAMLASVLPFGAFWLERQMRRGAFPS
jgi:integral membrane protein